MAAEPDFLGLQVATPVGNRGCGGCTLCCKLLPVAEIAKPAATWCPHCELGMGCGIYLDRPHGCRIFYCGWLVNGNVGPHWRPRDSRMVIDFQPLKNRMVVHVDPGRPDGWRKAPYRGDLQAQALRMAETGGYVLIACGAQFVMLVGQQEFPLGRLLPGETIRYTRHTRPGGWDFNVRIAPGEDNATTAERVIKPRPG
jgi:hypothetical protein